MLDLTDHQNAALAGLLQKRFEYSRLFFECEVLSAPPPTRRNSAIAYRFSLNESVALFADPSDGQSGRLSGLLQTHRKSQWKNHRLRLAQLFDRYGIGDSSHRTIDNFFPACNSGHVILQVYKPLYYGSNEMEME